MENEHTKRGLHIKKRDNHLERKFRLEIMHYILRTIKNCGRPAETIYGIKIPLQLIDYYITHLIQNGLLVSIRKGTYSIYQLTDIGLRYVENYATLIYFSNLPLYDIAGQ